MEKITPMNTDWLRANGFTHFGKWAVPKQKLQRKIAIERTAGVYAFVVDDVVRYVGKASHLRGRVRSYNRWLKPREQRPFRSAHDGIACAIAKGAAVEVYVRRTPDEPAATILERELIAKLDPSWNRTNYKKLPTLDERLASEPPIGTMRDDDRKLVWQPQNRE